MFVYFTLDPFHMHSGSFVKNHDQGQQSWHYIEGLLLGTNLSPKNPPQKAIKSCN